MLSQKLRDVSVRPLRLILLCPLQIQQEIPERYFDVGIAEQHAVTFCAGLATEGFTPVAAIYSTFLQRGFDQIVHVVLS